MGSSEHSDTTGVGGVGTTVFTDGACSGNPGPGGWAWVQPEGGWATGFEPDTTNQRMELTAVLRACERFEDPLRIVSDSTYVVNCWRDRWWQGWLKRNWRNSRKEPVANRDLWEQVVPHFRARAGLRLEWVKGHSGDRWNDLADRLAVAAIESRSGAGGSSPPREGDLGDPDLGGRDAPRRSPVRNGDESRAGTRGFTQDRDAPDGLPSDGARRSDAARARDGRVPEGFLVTVTGLRSPGTRSADAELTLILRAWAEMHPDARVLTGLRAGAEELAVAASSAAGVPHVVVLPYPNPAAGWPETEQARFAAACDSAAAVVTLERKRPPDADGRRKGLARRDGWLRSVSDVAVVLTDGRDREAENAVTQWSKALGDDVWRLEVGAST